MKYRQQGVSGYHSLHWAVCNLVTVDHKLKSTPDWSDEIGGLHKERAQAAVHLADLVESMLADTI